MKKRGRYLALILGIISIAVVILGGIFLGVIAVAVGFLIGIVGIIAYNKSNHKGIISGLVTSVIGVCVAPSMVALCLTSGAPFGTTVDFSKVLHNIFSLMLSKDPKAKYSNVRYSGHGFDYMHGYSSTDFSDYTVRNKQAKLVILDHKPPFIIKNQEDMPILDGAEACYPLYSSIAKNLYKDIDIIENNTIDHRDKEFNGTVVTFTNTIHAFERLVYNDAVSKVDMVFGAKPSKSQLDFAAKNGVDIEITKIGREGFVFFVEDDNPVDNLTSEQIKSIYHGDIKNWKDVGGLDQEIVAFQRPENSGSQTVMEYFMDGLSIKIPTTWETAESMGRVTKEVAQYASEDGAMAYTFRYFLEELNQEKGVKMISVDGVYPSVENIESGAYPLTVDLCLLTRKNDPNPYVKKMIDFILSDDGQYIIRQTGYAGVNQ